MDDLPILGIPRWLVPPTCPAEALVAKAEAPSNTGAKADETLIIHARLGAMHPAALRTRVAIGLVCLLVCASTAGAQTSGYISGAAFADIRQFGSTSSQSPLFGEDYSRDAVGVGGGVRVGTWVHPRWTLEVGAEVATKTTATFNGPVIAIFPPPPAFNLRSSTSFVNVSAMVGFHSPTGRRVRLGYLAGFSFIRASHTTDLPGFPFPTFEFDQGLLGSLRTFFDQRSTTLSEKRNSGAFTLGFEAAIDMTSRLAVVPEVRASTFSTSASGPSTFLIRPGVSVRWKF